MYGFAIRNAAVIRKRNSYPIGGNAGQPIEKGFYNARGLFNVDSGSSFMTLTVDNGLFLVRDYLFI